MYGYALGNPGRWVDPRGERVLRPMSPAPELDGGVEQCISQICTYQYDEEIDDSNGSGFPGRICHYRCPNGKWFTTTQIGRQGCKPGIVRDAGPLSYSVPLFIGPLAPRAGGGGGGGRGIRPAVPNDLRPMPF